MGMNSNQKYSWEAENNQAFCSMSADTPVTHLIPAIILLMAVIFIMTVCNHLALDIIISIILGVIILMVRGKIKPVSRTR